MRIRIRKKNENKENTQRVIQLDWIGLDFGLYFSLYIFDSKAHTMRTNFYGQSNYLQRPREQHTEKRVSLKSDYRGWSKLVCLELRIISDNPRV